MIVSGDLTQTEQGLCDFRWQVTQGSEGMDPAVHMEDLTGGSGKEIAKQGHRCPGHWSGVRHIPSQRSAG